ncbi:MAG TPA: P-II family nitrogen regulator [Clostridiales bacterium]|nr:P-II family nitrogen regulator [Clostridiales bacterium]
MLHLMVTITDRHRLADFISLYRTNNILINYITLGHGTAANEILDLLGLAEKERAVCFAVVDDETWFSSKRTLERKMKIDVPGTGIAFTVPMSSIGGGRELKMFTGGFNYQRGEVSELKKTDHELIVVICNQGYSGQVMDAAREVGAGGGTIIHAKGTGMKEAEKFLGITLASEKEMIFIVSRTHRKNAIMQAIMEKAGLDTKAKAVTFSLPVTDTAGLRLIEDESNGEEI